MPRRNSNVTRKTVHLPPRKQMAAESSNPERLAGPLLPRGGGTFFGLARLLERQSVISLEARLPAEGEFKPRNNPGIVYISPNARPSRLSNGDLANRRGRAGIMEALENYEELAASAFGRLTVQAIGLRLMINKKNQQSTHAGVILEDKLSPDYRLKYQIVGEKSASVALAEVRNSYLAKLQADAEIRAPLHEANLGLIAGYTPPPMARGLVRFDDGPIPVTLQPIGVIRQ